MQKIRLLFLVCLFDMIIYNPVFSQSDSILQENKSKIELNVDSKLNVKLNSLVLIGIVNPAVEFSIMKKVTMQLESFGSFYSSNFLGTGKPFVLGSGFLEFRYYPRFAFRGFFIGPNMGFGVYKLNKSLVLGFKDSYNWDCYHQGCNLMVGATIGYQWNVNKHWSIEVVWGGGFQESKYEAYHRDKNDELYVMSVGLNASAEWLALYKGGVFIGYRF